MLLSFFQLSLAIRNVWPRRMSLKAFLALYILLLLAGIPVRFLSCIPYGLFGILAAACIYGLVTCRDTAPQNICMTMIGFMLAVMTDNLLNIFLEMLVPSFLLLSACDAFSASGHAPFLDGTDADGGKAESRAGSAGLHT